MPENYQRQLDRLLISLGEGAPRLLLHSCCGPCSSYVVEYLAPFFDLTVFYYNPNIWPYDEYLKRRNEQQRLLAEAPYPRPVRFMAEDAPHSEFLARAAGLESEPEGGLRCRACIAQRLERTAERAREGGYDWFCSTLSVSPHKDAAFINESGLALSARYGVGWLPNDFKKRGGYLRSVELSRLYGLYRQDYCGCEYAAQVKKDSQEVLS